MENNALLLGPVFLPLIGMILGLAAARNNHLQRSIAVVVAVLAWLCSLLLLYQNWDEGAVQVYRLGNWIPPYGIILVADMLSALFGAMVTTVLLAGVIYVYRSIEKCVTYPAFVPLFLGMCTGLAGAIYTGDIFTLFVFIELMVLTSVVLVAVSDNQLGLEAALKYLIMSAMGSLFLLIGIAAVYTTVGTLNMADIADKINADEPILLTRAAGTMLLAAFLLKSAVFPFHFWQPDFHTTAPTPVGAMLSSVVVKVGIYGIIRMVTLLFVGDAARAIENVVIVLGLIGIFFGSLAAIRTYNAKRMLAYSTFGQVGFILVGIGWGTPAALLGAIVYAVNHAFIKSSLLMLTGVVSSHNKVKSARFSEIVGGGKKLVFVSFLYFLGGMALSGIPPMNGFISKLALVQGGIDARSWVSVGLVVGAGALTLLYMTRAWSLMFQQKPTEETVALKEPGQGDSVLAPALLIALCVLFGLYADPLVDVASRAVEQINNSEIYITAVLSPLESISVAGGE